MEEQVGRFGLEGDVADLVDDRLAGSGRAGQFFLEPAGVVGFGEPIDPLAGGREQHPMSGLAGPDTQPDGQMGLAGAGWAEEDHILFAGNEVQRAEVGDQVPFQPTGVVEVEFLKALAAGNRAARMRPSPPCASRAATSRCRQAARNSSWDQHSERARSASRPTSPARWALSTPVSRTQSRWPGPGSLTWLRLRPELNGAQHPEQAIKIAVRGLARRCQALNEEIAALEVQLSQLTLAVRSRLLARPGIGIDTAAQLLITAGDNPDRLRSEAAFARLVGVAPIPASSGRTDRHRLSRGGDRQANRVLHTIALVRLHRDPRTWAYLNKRTAQGLSKRTFRCLKRAIAREVYHDLRPT